MKFQVTEVIVTFDRGSFEDWCNASGDECDPDDIARWESAYNTEIAAKLKEIYPHASIEVGEGYDQTGRAKIYIDFKEVESGEDHDVEEWKVDEITRMEVDAAIDRIGNWGKFWEA